MLRNPERHDGEIVAKCKCFNTSHEHHSGNACTDAAEASGYCRRCNDSRKKDFAKSVSMVLA
jgi:hypothetical protein